MKQGTLDLLSIFFISLTLSIYLVQPQHVRGQTIIPSNTIISADTTWTVVNSPYLIEGTLTLAGQADQPITLTIEAGVVVQFKSNVNAQLIVGINGAPAALVALGTEQDPIFFTSDGSAVPGVWSGIVFTGFATSSSLLEYVTVEYAGSNFVNVGSSAERDSAIRIAESGPTIRNSTLHKNAGGAISFTSSDYGILSNSIETATLENNRIQDNSGYGLSFNSEQLSAPLIQENIVYDGIRFTNPIRNLDLRNNTISAQENRPLQIYANQIEAVTTNNTLVDLEKSGYVNIFGEQIDRDTTWIDLGIPYHIEGQSISITGTNGTSATLTLEAGVQMLFNSSYLLDIGLTGGLNAVGTAEQPVEFAPLTGDAVSNSAQLPGRVWPGIRINSGSIGVNFDHVVIRDGTVWVSGSEFTLLRSTVSGSSTYCIQADISATVAVEDSTIKNCLGDGIRLSSEASLGLIRSLIQTVGGNGIFADVAATVSVEDSIIENCNRDGIRFPGGVSLSLTRSHIRRVSGYGIYAPSSGAITFEDNTIEETNAYSVSIEDSRIISLVRNTLRDGLQLSVNTDTLPIVSNNTINFRENQVLRAEPNVINLILTENDINVRSTEAIEVMAGTVSVNAMWRDHGVPYRILGTIIVGDAHDDEAETLTILAGTTLQFDRGAGLETSFSASGGIVANGTSEHPVTFTSSQEYPLPGDWVGIAFKEQFTSESALRYSIVEYAEVGITIQRTSPETVTGTEIRANHNILLANNIIRYSQSYGILAAEQNFALRQSSALGQIVDNFIHSNGNYGIRLNWRDNFTIRGNSIQHGIWVSEQSDSAIINNVFVDYDGTYPIRIGSDSPSADLRGNRLEGVTDDSYIILVGTGFDSLNFPLVLADLGVPYVVRSDDIVLDNGGVLFIEPGVELRFDPGLYLEVKSGGRLIAQGTWDEPIRFTSSLDYPYPGAWAGIDIQSNNPSLLENCFVEYAGRLPELGAVFGAVTVRNDPMSGHLPLYLRTIASITRCQIKDSSSYGLAISDALPNLINNRFMDNVGNDIFALPASGRMGLSDVVVSLNYWGGEPVGDGNIYGDTASPGVTINPWLTTPDGGHLFDAAQVYGEAFSPNGGRALIFAKLNAQADWVLSIEDSNRTVVHRVSGNGNTITVEWDGRQNNVPMLNSDYRFEVVATATDGTQDTITGKLTVNDALPALWIEAPLVGSTIQAGIFEIRGTAAIADIQEYRLDVATVDDPMNWFPIASVQSTPIISDVLYRWNASSLLATDYLLRLTVVDSQNIQSALVIPFSVETISIELVSFNTQTIDPSLGERVTISYTLSEAANVTMVVNNITLVNAESVDPGRHEVEWDGRDSNGVVVADGAYFVVIYAEDAEGRRTYFFQPWSITRLELSPQSIIQDQTAGTLQVTYLLDQPAIVRLRYGMDATRTRTGTPGILGAVVPYLARTAGEHSEVWQYASPAPPQPSSPQYMPEIMGRAGGGIAIGGGGGGGGAMGTIPPVQIDWAAVLSGSQFNQRPVILPPEIPPHGGDNNRLNYMVELQAWALPANTIIVRSQSNTIGGTFVEPSTVMPTLGQVANVIYTLEQSAAVRVGVYSGACGQPTLIYELTTIPNHAAGTYSLIWDGRDTQGRVVTNGRYLIIVEATSMTGQLTTRCLSFRVGL